MSKHGSKWNVLGQKRPVTKFIVQNEVAYSCTLPLSEQQEEERALTEVTLEILSELATGNAPKPGVKETGSSPKLGHNEATDRMLMPPPKFGLDMAGLGLKDTIQVTPLW